MALYPVSSPGLVFVMLIVMTLSVCGAVATAWGWIFSTNNYYFPLDGIVGVLNFPHYAQLNTIIIAQIERYSFDYWLITSDYFLNPIAYTFTMIYLILHRADYVYLWFQIANFLLASTMTVKSGILLLRLKDCGDYWICYEPVAIPSSPLVPSLEYKLCIASACLSLSHCIIANAVLCFALNKMYRKAERKAEVIYDAPIGGKITYGDVDFGGGGKRGETISPLPYMRVPVILPDKKYT